MRARVQVEMTQFVLAFDLGGTRLKAALVDAASGSPEKVRLTDVAGATASEAIDALISVGTELVAGTTPFGCGLCVPGLVDGSGTVVDLVGKLDGIVGMDLVGAIKQGLHLDGVVINDAIAYATGESTFGAGRDFSRSVVVTIGTGIGVTVIEDGNPIGRGPMGGGIISGHIPISERTSGPADSNNHHWTIEALCCAQRIVDYANQGGGDFTDVAQVYAAFEAGDESARKGIEEYRLHLARALVALGHAHAPEVIILGGGPMTQGNPVAAGLDELVSPHLWGNYRFEIKTAELGDAAALAGLARIFVNRTTR